MIEDFEAIAEMNEQLQDDREYDPQDPTPEEELEFERTNDMLVAAMKRIKGGLH